MCGQDLTKTRATRSTVMGGLEFNKRYQIACMWRGSMFVKCEPLFCSYCYHPTFDLQNSFPLFLPKGDHGPHHAWAAQASLSSCLPYSWCFLLKQLCVSFICSSYRLPFCWLCSCYSSKLVFLMLSKLTFLKFFQVLVAPSLCLSVFLHGFIFPPQALGIRSSKFFENLSMLLLVFNFLLCVLAFAF